jgi:hypothetical protein
MAMTIAALTAAAVGGMFSTSDQCLAKVNGAVGKVIAAALLKLPLPGNANNLLQSFINGSLPISFDELMVAIGLPNIAAYIQCGCSVAGAPADLQKLVEEYAKAAESCANFASDVADAILDTAGDLGEAIVEGLHGTAMKPGIQMEQECAGPKILPDDIWTATPIHLTTCGAVLCKAGHFVVEKEEGGKKLNKCSTTCPEPIHDKVTPGAACYSWTEWAVVEVASASGGWKVEKCTPSIQKAVCCGDDQKVFEWGKCTPDCTPGSQGWSDQKNKCEYCPAGTKSDGRGPCIACAGEKSLVANGACQTCKPWQKVHLASVQDGGSQCQDICPNGVYVGPGAPSSGQKVSAGSPPVQAITSAPAQGVPAQGGPGGSGAGGVVAAPSATSLPSPGGGAPGGTLVATPNLGLTCLPCGANEYVQNNQCHSCGPKAVVSSNMLANPFLAGGTCTPCSGRQVAKLIDGAMTCAAECSKVGGGGKARPSTNFITDPKNPSRCIACAAGMKPNDTRTACLGKAALSSKPVLTTPGADTVRKKKGSRDKAARKATSVKLICPPRTHPNASGTGCVPDLDMPGFDGPGVGPPAMGGRGGRAR